jgi:hypothetical protein
MSRAEVAAEWYEREYVPVVELLRDAGLLGPGTETDSYQLLSSERYRLLRTHEWSDEAIETFARQPPKR